MKTTLKVFLCTHCGKLIPVAESDAHCATHEMTPIPAVASERERLIAEIDRAIADSFRVTRAFGRNVITEYFDGEFGCHAEAAYDYMAPQIESLSSQLNEAREALKRAQADALDARITWRSGEEIPTLTEGDDQGFIVCVQRAPSGKRYVFAATYVNKFEIEWDSFANGDYTTATGNRWQAEPGEEHDHATGWFVEDATDEPRYSPLLSADDQLVAWAEFPKAETVDAALRTSSPDPVVPRGEDGEKGNG